MNPFVIFHYLDVIIKYLSGDHVLFLLFFFRFSINILDDMCTQFIKQSLKFLAHVDVDEDLLDNDGGTDDEYD